MMESFHIGSKKRKMVVEVREDQEENVFDRLPDEMLDMILEFVQTPEASGSKDGDAALATARLVCHRWNNVVIPKLEHRGILTDSSINSFVQLDPEIKLKSLILSELKHNRVKTVRGRGGLQSPENLHWICSNTLGGRDYDPRLFRRSVEHLIIGGEAGIILKKHKEAKELPYSLSTGFAEDQRILDHVDHSIKGQDLGNIVSRLQDVKTLTLSSIAFLSVKSKILKKIKFSSHFRYLSTLDVCIGKKTDPTKVVLMFKKATFPVLSSLYIRVYSMCFYFSLIIDCYRFIAKHSSLKNLSFSQAQAVYGVPRDNCPYPDLELSAYPQLVENLMKVKLECLRMDCMITGSSIGQEWKDLEIAFIKNQTSLRGLELQVNLRSLDRRLDEVIPSCEKTLERLELSSLNVTPNHFNCSSISAFSKLKDCHLYLRNQYCGKNNNEELQSVKIEDIHMLPSSIESLHLGRLPSVMELRDLKKVLGNLKRVSYSCADLAKCRMNPTVFVEFLVEHLKFPRLVEYRMYQYACPVVAEFLHRQDGLVSYIEDEDSVVVLVDRDEFNIEAFGQCISSLSTCNCSGCITIR